MLQGFGIAKVVTSPFKRCIQTAQIACTVLNLPSTAVEADWELSEVSFSLHGCYRCCSSTQLCGGRRYKVLCFRCLQKVC